MNNNNNNNGNDNSTVHLDAQPYTDNLSVKSDDTLYTHLGTYDSDIYIYKIAEIDNYTITQLCDPVLGSNLGTPSLTAHSDCVNSTSVANSVSNAFSNTVTNGKSISISKTSEFSAGIDSGFVLSVSSALTVGGEFSWSNSATNTTEYSKTISEEYSTQKGWSVTYVIDNVQDGYYYRLAYICPKCEIFQYTVVDRGTGETDTSYGIYYSGNRAIALQYSTDGNFDIPVNYKVQSSHTGSYPSKTFGTSTDPYAITNLQDMKLIEKAPGAYYKMMSDIDLSETSWAPFEFSGNLNGNNCKIVGLNLKYTDSSESILCGLFTKNNGTISDLTIDSEKILVAPHNFGSQVNVKIGFLAGINYGTISKVVISNSTIDGDTTDIDYLWKQKYGDNASIPAKKSDNNKKAEGSWASYASLYHTGKLVKDGWASNKAMCISAGAICGENIGSISKATVENSTTISVKLQNFNYNSSSGDDAKIYVGGIAGINSNSIKNCNSNAKIDATIDLHNSGDGSAEGLGYAAGTAYKPAGKGFYGGIAGSSTGTITGSSSTNDVKTTSNVFAPVYILFSGSDYSGSPNTCNGDNISWTKCNS